MEEVVGAYHADVAPEVQALTDATRPLPAGAVFWPTLAVDDGEAGFDWHGTIGVVGWVGIYVVSMYRWIGALWAGTFEGDAVETFLALHVVMVFPAAWIVYPRWQRAQRDRPQPAGRRRGVFLLPEHVVVYNGDRYAVLRRAPGRFEVRRRWRPIRRSWDFRVTPGFTEAFTVEMDARHVAPEVSTTVIAAYTR